MFVKQHQQKINCQLAQLFFLYKNVCKTLELEHSIKIADELHSVECRVGVVTGNGFVL